MVPRFVFIDRMGGELNREQIDNIYRLLREASITYLSIGDGHRLEPYHERVLEVRGEGRWDVTRAGESGRDDAPEGQRLVTDAAGGLP
jgi:ABC-type uncharacterized transport system fused permease/ATPase subunit